MSRLTLLGSTAFAVVLALIAPRCALGQVWAETHVADVRADAAQWSPLPNVTQLADFDFEGNLLIVRSATANGPGNVIFPYVWNGSFWERYQSWQIIDAQWLQTPRAMSLSGSQLFFGYVFRLDGQPRVVIERYLRNPENSQWLLYNGNTVIQPLSTGESLGSVQLDGTTGGGSNVVWNHQQPGGSSTFESLIVFTGQTGFAFPTTLTSGSFLPPSPPFNGTGTASGSVLATAFDRSDTRRVILGRSNGAFILRTNDAGGNTWVNQLGTGISEQEVDMSTDGNLLALVEGGRLWTFRWTNSGWSQIGGVQTNTDIRQIALWDTTLVALTGNPGASQRIRRYAFNASVTEPFAFGLVSPANNAVVGCQVPSNFRWESALGATSYDLVIARDPQLQDIVVTRTGLTGSQVTLPPGTITTGGVLYWGLRAFNSVGSVPSTPVSRAMTVTGAPSGGTLTAPADGETGVSRNPVLSWTPSSGASNYTVSVWFSSDLTGLAWSATVPSSSTMVQVDVPLLAGRTYWWNVVANGGCGASPLSPGSRSFTTGLTAPGAFSLIAPSDSATACGSSGVTFSWQPSANAAAYRLRVSTGLIPDNSPFIDLPNLTATSVQVPASAFASIPNVASLSWNVVASNAAGLKASPTGNCTITRSSPGEPLLRSPANGVSVSSPPTLSWSPGDATASTTVVVGGDSAFSTIVAEVNAGTASSVTLSASGLVAGQTYFWRVVGQNGCGNAPSAVRSFVYAPVATAGLFDLVSPADGSTSCTLRPTLSWTASTDATQYAVIVSSSPSLVPGQGIATVTTTSYTPTADLGAAGETIYWGVAARAGPGDLGRSSSPVSRAITLGSAQVAPSLIDPPAGTVISSDLTFRWSNAPGATTHRLAVYSDAVLTNLISGNEFTPNQTSIVLPLVTFGSSSTVYVRVEATGPCGTINGATRVFSIQHPQPQAFDLFLPADGTFLCSGPFVIFSWQQSTNAVGYVLEISSDPSFASTLRSFQIGPTTFSAVNLPDLEGQRLFWRVLARSGSGQASVVSNQTNSFTLAGPSLSVVPLEPSAEAVIVSGPVSLRWQPLTGAFGYNVRVSNDPSMSPTLFSGSVGTGQSTLAVPANVLAQGQALFWQVSASTSCGTFQSPVSRFTYFQTPCPVGTSAIPSPPAGTASQLGSTGPSKVVWDATNQRTLFIGGVNPTTGLSEPRVWALGPSGWSSLTTVPGGVVHAAAWDAARGQLVVLGASSTLRWTGSTWLDTGPGGTRPPAGPYSATFDGQRGRVVLLSNSSGTSRRTWEWDGTIWREGPSANGNFFNGGIAFDPVTGRVISMPFGSGLMWYDGVVWGQQSLQNSVGNLILAEGEQSPQFNGVAILSGMRFDAGTFVSAPYFGVLKSDQGVVTEVPVSGPWISNVRQRLGGGSEFFSPSVARSGDGLLVAGAFTTGLPSPNDVEFFAIKRVAPLQPAVPSMLQGEVVAAPNSTLFVRARASSQSAVRYEWLRHGVPVAFGSGGASPGGGFVATAPWEFSTSHSDLSLDLVIQSVQVSDSGTYTLRATGPCGVVVGTPVAVRIEGPPPPPPCPADITNTDGDLPGVPDGVIDNGDFQAFFAAFFMPESDSLRLAADVANTDGETVLNGGGPDGAIDNGDFNAFFAAFFGGCP